MRKCRHCDGAIEDAATSCPHCQRDLFPGRTAAAAVVVPEPQPSGRALLAPPDPTIARVSVVDIAMPFESMVLFMIKWAIAAIPAFLILLGLAFAVFFALAMIGALGSIR